MADHASLKHRDAVVPQAWAPPVQHSKGFTMDQIELFERLGVALAAGLLVGLERGWRTREDADSARAAGLRTFGLSGLLGGICGALGVATHPIVLAAGLLAFTAAVGAFIVLQARTDHNFSATGLVAAILTFALGAYAVVGAPAVAIAAAVAMTILLALRDQLHGIIRGVTWLELRAVLTLLAMTFLLLPILPDRTIDPWGAINPSEVWLLAILIAAVSFVGYVLVRMSGSGVGIGLASITGGLTSSTATTIALARMTRTSAPSTILLAGGVLLAGSTMMFRIVAIVFFVRPELAARLLPALAVGGLVSAVAGASMIFGREQARQEGARTNFGLKNPFELGTALKLAALIAIIGLFAQVVALRVGDSGVFGVAALSGLVDVDAVTLSFARMSHASLALDSAALAILVAVTTNTLSKTVMAALLGGRAFGVLVALVNAATLAAMYAAYWLLPFSVALSAAAPAAG
ncbi:MAG: hypothetical protein RLZZ227_2896 [Pseudomonadota bacterium]